MSNQLAQVQACPGLCVGDSLRGGRTQIIQDLSTGQSVSHLVLPSYCYTSVFSGSRLLDIESPRPKS